MKNALRQEINFEQLLCPETELEKQLLKEREFQKGLLWGTPRFGHPEGKVVFHIREVLDNIEKIPLSDHQRSQLRLITFAHDTFKFKEVKAIPRDWTKHHGKLARNFMKKFTNDQTVLDIIDLHDEAYYAWRCAYVYDDEPACLSRLADLMQRIGPNLQLYYLFFKSDTRTGDKNQHPVKWFEREIKGIDIVKF